MSKELYESALEYHRQGKPGKIEVTPTKPLTTQRDLSLAYSPGVAAACEVIVEDPNEASTVTARGNLVAVITNGTAVLGLGAIGPLAAKPVMEGKGVLFKKFAGIDVFDIEIDETEVDKLVDIIASLEPTFGGINLEDFKAPECFEVEKKLRKRLHIPVFHDDQHGTAIIASAAVLNAIRLAKKDIGKVKLAASGAGAAGIACLDLLVSLGLNKKNILVCDRKGVIYKGRDKDLPEGKARYARETKARTLADAVKGADIFLGVSGPGVLKPEMVKSMAKNPLILALANPVPEIMPDEAKAVRPDALVATGRSDFPNQVNNVLCFPYIFRGALDVGATVINEEMKVACVHAIADLAQQEASETAARAYGGRTMQFGADYLIPQPFDTRLLVELAPAVAEAAMKSGVAERPIEDMRAYREQLNQFVFRTGLTMKPIFERARAKTQRVIYAEGEDERVLRAVQTVVDDGLAEPILIGRPDVVKQRIKKLGLRIKADRDFELVNIHDDPRFKEYWQLYHSLMERKGVTPNAAKNIAGTRPTVIAALSVRRGDADAMIAGVVGRYERHLKHVLDIIGLKDGVRNASALNAMILHTGVYFFCDTYVNWAPDVDELVECTILAAEEVRRFGIEPKVALVSHSNFGTHNDPSANKMRAAVEMLHRKVPELEVDGEMHADAALSEEIRKAVLPNSVLSGTANLLVMSSLASANVAFNLVKALGNGVTIGPILLGVRQPAHVLTPSATSRRVVNMTALAAVDASDGEVQGAFELANNR
ncbi:MAG: NADP-dependent malic enzyme [Gammaproteobacteria bacterium]|nr:MAG: NADP-dependent malic enzyme [Gammaproteobacteria bacterium]